jgi:TonB family protein
LREETPRQVKPKIEAGGFATAETSSAPGGNRRALATGGFDARPHPETAPAERKLSNTRAFGDATVESPARRPNQPIGEARFEPVEILFKPRPLYTTEARKRQIEGEVLLETVFSASGDVRVLRVLSGLGYGLDESAITAARAMRFRPARREGVAVDAIATVHIVFQLAY